MLFRIILVITLVISFFWLKAQQDSLIYDENKIIEILEIAFEENETSSDYLPSTENLAYLLNHPININKATVSELKETNVFRDQEILLIMKHRKRYGGFVEKEELRSIPTIDIKRAQFLSHFITIKEYSYNKKLDFSQGNHLIMSRQTSVIERQQGFENNNFQGDQWQRYFRYKYQLDKRLGFGMTLERDAGEPFFQGVNKPSFRKANTGFDYFSGHLYYKPTNSVLQGIYVGDYALTFGQGVHMWNGLSFGKLATAVDVKRSGPEISSYRSVNEWNYMRGGALNLGNSNLNFTTFYSNKFRDASFSSDTIDDQIITSNSLQITGLHRTDSEQANKNDIREIIYGGRVSYQKSHFHIGLTHSYTYYDQVLEKNDELYNTFSFKGQNLHNTGIDIKYISTHLEYFGENVLNNEKEHAHINGLNFLVSDNLKFNITHRYYSKGYLSAYGSAFGDRSNTNNETGIYFGLNLVLGPKWYVATFYDLYKFPWATFNSISPINGRQYLAQLHYNPTNDLQMYWRVRNTKEEENSSSTGIGLKEVITTDHTQLRYHISYKPIWFVALKTRAELVRWKDNNSTDYGHLIYQDIQYKFPFIGRKRMKNRYPLVLTARIAFVDIESFDSRIYTYENDVLYTFNIRSYTEEAMRYYLMLRYNITKNLKIWARYSRLTLPNSQSSISSGNSFIDGSSRSDIRFQLMYQF